MIAASGDHVVAINLSSGLLFGVICAVIAAGRGRSGLGWFFIGLFIQCFGLILVLVLPNLRDEESAAARSELQNRRLREQLAKERQVSDERHGHVERRLGSHDEVLGIDTSAPPELPPGTAPAAQLTSGDQWFYARDNERQGPVSSETIRHLLQVQAIAGETLVWCDGMQDWAPLADVDAFRGDVT